MIRQPSTRLLGVGSMARSQVEVSPSTSLRPSCEPPEAPVDDLVARPARRVTRTARARKRKAVA